MPARRPNKDDPLIAGSRWMCFYSVSVLVPFSGGDTSYLLARRSMCGGFRHVLSVVGLRF